MAKTIKTQLREIAEARVLTAKQRAFVTTQSEAMGVPFVKTACRDCYKDQAVRLWRVVCEKEAQEKGRKYILRGGIDVIWRGVRVNMTKTDTELARLLDDGFPRNFFSRINGEDGQWL